MKPSSPIYALLLADVSIISATEDSITAELKLQSMHLNSKGTLHGTVSACLVDWASSMAIAATGRDKTGVSTDLHVSYVSTAKADDTLRIEAMASKVGTTLAYTTVQVSRVSDGQVICHGLHTKFVRQ